MKKSKKKSRLNRDFLFGSIVESSEAVAPDLVRFRDESEGFRIAFRDNVLDLVDLALGRDAGEHFVLFACIIADAVRNRDTAMQAFDKLFRNLVWVI